MNFDENNFLSRNDLFWSKLCLDAFMSPRVRTSGEREKNVEGWRSVDEEA